MNLPSLRATPAFVLFAAASTLWLVPAHVRAHGDGHEDGGETKWGLGLAVLPERSPYRGVDAKTEVLPAITVENRWVRLFGPQLEVRLGRAGPVGFGLTATYGRDGYKPGDSPSLDGMARRRDGIWLGLRARIRSEAVDATFDVSGDAASHSKGSKAKLGLERRFGFQELGVSPRVAAVWHDRRYVQYYYGVEPGEARADRAAYAPGSAVDGEVGVRLDYRLTPQQLVLADVGWVSLGRAVRDSPLVDRSSVPEVRLVWLYRF